MLATDFTMNEGVNRTWIQKLLGGPDAVADGLISQLVAVHGVSIGRRHTKSNGWRNQARKTNSSESCGGWGIKGGGGCGVGGGCGGTAMFLTLGGTLTRRTRRARS